MCVIFISVAKSTGEPHDASGSAVAVAVALVTLE